LAGGADVSPKEDEPSGLDALDEIGKLTVNLEAWDP
jgi:hypothetical protein